MADDEDDLEAESVRTRIDYGRQGLEIQIPDSGMKTGPVRSDWPSWGFPSIQWAMVSDIERSPRCGFFETPRDDSSGLFRRVNPQLRAGSGLIAIGRASGRPNPATGPGKPCPPPWFRGVVAR